VIVGGMENPTAAELSAAAEGVHGYQRRVAQLAATFRPGERDDLVTAIDEAERSLGVAERTLRRALRLATR
jgi:hypothetical protein